MLRSKTFSSSCTHELLGLWAGEMNLVILRTNFDIRHGKSAHEYDHANLKLKFVLTQRLLRVHRLQLDLRMWTGEVFHYYATHWLSLSFMERFNEH